MLAIADQPEPTPRPWEHRVEHAEVALRCRWPRRLGARTLRGAIVAQIDHLSSGGAHIDWHNHLSDEEIRNADPHVMYRVTDGRPRVWLWGPRAHQHARELAGFVHALRLPAGEVIEVEEATMSLDATDTTCGLKKWRLYETWSPIFPAEAGCKRRPARGMGREAWAGNIVRSSLRMVLESYGHDPARLSDRLHVQVKDYKDVEGLEWSRPQKGKRDRGHGFHCRFWTTAVLPDGLGIGRHKSEGFGEVRRVQ